MKCEYCKQNEAAFFYEETVNGQHRSFHLCPACAEKLRAEGKLSPFLGEEPFLPNLSVNFLDGLFGLTQKAAQVGSSKTCPGCGAHWSDLVEDGKARCPLCYKTFAEELEPTLRSVHGSVLHTGRAPARRRAVREREQQLAQLKQELRAAIEEERYEKAAELRDQIRGLETKGGDDAHGVV